MNVHHDIAHCYKLYRMTSDPSQHILHELDMCSVFHSLELLYPSKDVTVQRDRNCLYGFHPYHSNGASFGIPQK